jgi:hypothetical protein
MMLPIDLALLNILARTGMTFREKVEETIVRMLGGAGSRNPAPPSRNRALGVEGYRRLSLGQIRPAFFARAR